MTGANSDQIIDPRSADAKSGRRRFNRRAFLGSLGGAAAGAGALATGLRISSDDAPTVGGNYRNEIEPFYGAHQGGITTSAQSSTYFAAFDLSTERRSEVEELFRVWSVAAADLSDGRSLKARSYDASEPEPDSGETIGLGPARLTVTLGLGPGLFDKEGSDRFGLRSKRPEALVDLPRFPNDQLIGSKTGGDLTIQACADDPQVAFHAVRQLARVANGIAAIRWTQAGFNETPASKGTPRNLMGFKDGTINPTGSQLDEFVWVGPEGPSWMRRGSYLVVRRIRISLEHWDQKSSGVQEQVIGRHKLSGAPLGRTSEFDSLDLDATGADGNPVIPADSHVRLSSPQSNKGRMILRRGYAYNDGVDPFVERWPPWEQALLFDAGILFLAYQRDPRRGFIPIFQNLADNDALGQFTTQTGSVIVAVPPAARAPGGFVGEGLFA